MDPASNQKVLATATAVLRLGSDWHFTTTAGGALPDGDGVVPGPIYLRGDGDPTLRTADLEDLASALLARGITRIEGGVLADDRPRVGVETSSERPPLVVNHNLVTVRVEPGDPGQPPLLAVEPEATWQIENEAKTVDKGRTRLAISVAARPQDRGSRLIIHVSGRIATSSAGVLFRRRIGHPALYSAAVFRSALQRAGITVNGEAGLGEEPRASHVLAAHDSAPLAVLLRRVNKDSDNDQAERVLDALGATWSNDAPTSAAGVAALRDALADLGAPNGSYVPRNGSGLGHENRVTADLMANVMRALYLDPRLGPELEQSLSVGGVDGTTRNRFKGTPESHRVRAKTGTLNGKSCLSGLVGDEGQVLAFSILVQGLRYRSLHAVRQAQVRAVSAMMRYLRDSASNGEPEEGTTPDFETGEEPAEMEVESELPAKPLPAGTTPSARPTGPAAPTAPGPAGASGAKATPAASSVAPSTRPAGALTATAGTPTFTPPPFTPARSTPAKDGRGASGKGSAGEPKTTVGTGGRGLR
jgi:D-alanyl-D-alanine carboxypeptidase/D-alanyl-D-alanine-endopeptidase (penicillin-binding protein 4)